jgi:hypothetical protein
MMGNDDTMTCPECGLTLYQEVSECPRCRAPIGPTAGAAPVVERIYEHEVVDTSPREKGGFKRPVTIIAVIIVVALLIISLSYFFLIPRIELSVITVYREGTGLSILVDSKVKNEGTLNIQHLTLNITVENASGGVVASGRYNLSDLEARSSHSFDNIHFIGDQYEPYRIKLMVRFEASGSDYTENYVHSVDEYMFSKFEDKFTKWGG